MTVLRDFPLDDEIGGSSAVLVATVDLSPAQILDLNASPIQIVAAPGAGKAWLILGGLLQRHGGTTPYTSDGTARLEVGGGEQVAQDYSTWETSHSGDSNVLTAGGTFCVQLAIPPTNNSDANDNNLYPADTVENQALVIGNPGSDFATGDFHCKVTLFYASVDLA